MDFIGTYKCDNMMDASKYIYIYIVDKAGNKISYLWRDLNHTLDITFTERQQTDWDLLSQIWQSKQQLYKILVVLCIKRDLDLIQLY